MESCIALLIILTVSTLSSELEVVQITCGRDSITVKFNEEIATSAGYKMSDFRFNDPTCKFERKDDHYFIRDIKPRNDCGGKVFSNKTHVIYSNSISTSDENIPEHIPFGYGGRLISVSYECSYEIRLRALLASSYNMSYQQIPMPNGTGEGFFRVNMAIYTNDTYMALKDKGNVLHPSDTLYFGIALIDDVKDVYILLRQCWTSPSQDPNATLHVTLIENGCPVDEFPLLNVAMNGVHEHALWNSRVSDIVEGDGDIADVWIHCKISLCVKQICEQSCNPRKKHRVLRQYENRQHIVSYGPLLVGEKLVNQSDEVDNDVDNATVTNFEIEKPALDLILIPVFAILPIFGVLVLAVRAGMS